MRVFILSGFVLASLSAFAQEQDTTKVLDPVTVKAYRYDRPLKDVPVTINVIDQKDLNRFGPASMVTTVNTVPGVRMEERSPGSYRFSIRGSVMRSPFGIRNVKFYYRGLPFTDGGGNTYLNLLDMSTLGRMEIAKGPGASLYGAGTGGVVMMEPPGGSNYNGEFSVQAGSYGLFRLSTQVAYKLDRATIDVGYSQQRNSGYRQQTALDRQNFRLNYDQLIGKNDKLTVTVLNGDLQYQTPGGLTRAQFEADPKQARPAAGPTKGAVEQQATIFNNTTFGGAVYDHSWNDHFTTNVALYGAYTDFKNPAIANFEQRLERNLGGRTETQYKFSTKTLNHKITFGGEYQSLKSSVRVFENLAGVRGNQRTHDRQTSDNAFVFLQGEFELPYQFLFTAGGSYNFLNASFKRVSVEPNVSYKRDFDPGFFPRVALSKKFGEQLTVYSSISEGFSAPTSGELLPSTSVFNNTLNPEKGRSVEVGIRTELFERQLKFNVAAYNFKLKETIVVRNTEAGQDYFVNAGTTSQKGIESTIAWTPRFMLAKFEVFRLWSSYTYNDYTFLNYVSGSTDLSGKILTGVPPTVVVSGLDMMLKKGWYANISLNYTDHIPVNDGNTEFARDYKILSARIGKRFNAWVFENIEIFLGGDNLLDQKYSLGNDLNAAGGRYYNAAPGRNFYGGITVPLGINQ